MDKGAKIEKDSFSIIESGMKRHFDELCLPVVKRVIHATGDFEFEDILKFSPGAITHGISAIRAGKDIFVDVKMVEAGINKKALAQFGGTVICFISDEDVAKAAKEKAMTRAECAVEKAFLTTAANIGIAAIGNAPTALIRLMEIIENKEISPELPELIVGVPVGFVKAEESKASLAKQHYPYITCLGKKGGSSIAAAIINAIVRLAAPPK
ncbi:precorrin-8X methylmutase [Candidatus Magnetominusculus xianensis]|uniref:Precorrin-8X methylmutase n=1 Tax=Candidatus Magnetominusculus xianensis TaxID=1748249 RepID=A0ABR5SE76_9BACT|nr:precorrin-8X methylmutase [Candidatus Magnetominusculus xianensis]KWT82657.1 precorrin-8X methylmutase [Candidatus Magnetominusculus xianensis]MBF0405332.1 precorrin-8X methylmutase [Nitrospirota bacterium]